MKLLIIILFCSWTFLSYSQSPSFMPMPESVKILSGKMMIDSNFTIAINGPESKRIREASVRFLERLGKASTVRIPLNAIVKRNNSALSITFKSSPEMPSESADESYSLKIESKGIILNAATDLGALRGLETLLQSMQQEIGGFYFPALEIKDSPRFAWRGLMMDACRHFMPVDVVKRTLDVMSSMKMNVFHWHLSEDQGFRVESFKFPLLHEKGSDGMYYTQAQIKDIVLYANLRGIRVIPEFDLPGHATAWLVGYPGLASAPGPYEIERFFGVFDPTFDPTVERTYEFLDAFFGEMAGLFPDPIMHIGGDENNGIQWNNNPAIQSFMNDNGIRDNHGLQVYFNKRLITILKKYNKQMMGWDEIMEEGLPTSAIIHSWRGKEFLVKAAEKGYKTVLSAGYYIDLSHSAAFHYKNDPITSDMIMTKEQQARILGGEAPMWAELVNEENVESRIWPRVAAIAERFWSPGDVKDEVDMYRRLLAVEPFLELSGSHHIRNREMMIRRLWGAEDWQILKNLLDWLEPIEGYNRHGSKPRYTSLVPLSRAVDASMPDARNVAEFRVLLDDYVKSKDSIIWKKMEEMIDNTIEQRQNLLQVLPHKPALREIIPLSDNVVQSAMITQQIMDYYAKNKTLKGLNTKDLLNRAAVFQTAHAELESGFLPMMQELVKKLE
jgi:hexosaminidase